MKLNKSVKNHNVVSVLFEAMKGYLQDGSWKAGYKLPSEAQLATQFGVSRVSVRSAVQKLRDMGAVITYQGKGTYVTDNIDKYGIDDLLAKPAMHLSEAAFRDMLVFRQTVEFKFIELAAQHADDEDIATLERLLGQMLINKNDYKKYSKADYEFHLGIVNAAKNTVFTAAMHAIKDIYYQYLEELNRTLGITIESIDAHLNVYLAIKNRDPQAAAEILDTHMASNLKVIQTLNEKNSCLRK